MELTHGQMLQIYVDGNHINITQLVKRLDMTRQNFYQLYKSALFETGTIKNLETAFNKKFADIEKYANVNIDKLPKKKIKINDAPGVVLENQIEIMSGQRVILSILSEIQSQHIKDKVTPDELLNIYRSMVKDEAVRVRDELGHRS